MRARVAAPNAKTPAAEQRARKRGARRGRLTVSAPPLWREALAARLKRPVDLQLVARVLLDRLRRLVVRHQSGDDIGLVADDPAELALVEGGGEVSGHRHRPEHSRSGVV